MSEAGEAKLFHEWALTPGVFDRAQWGAGGEMAHMMALGAMRTLTVDGGGFVRDLRDGAWARRAKELAGDDIHGPKFLKTLKERGRLLAAPNARAQPPVEDVDWCHEACASHKPDTRPLSAVLTVPETAKKIRESAVAKTITGLTVHRIATFDELTERAWWSPGSNTVSIERTTDAYLSVAGPLLDHAHSVWFIDPYLDPERPGYGSFIRLVQRLAARKTPPDEVQVHRAKDPDTGKSTLAATPEGLKARFERMLARVTGRRFKVQLFVWEKFHDRHLVTDVGGAVMGNGFDERSQWVETTTWSRHTYASIDAIRREFDPTSITHGKAKTFTLSP